MEKTCASPAYILLVAILGSLSPSARKHCSGFPKRYPFISDYLRFLFALDSVLKTSSERVAG